MTTINIKLSTLGEVQRFVNTISEFDSNFDVISGNYIVNGKSIMGILSLDLQKSLELKIYNCTPEILEALRPFATE